MLPKLLIAESKGFDSQAEQILREFAQVTLADLGRQELLKRIGNSEILWVRLRNQIDAEVFSAAPRLQIVATNTTGLNHIDLEAAAERNIQVISLRGETDFLKEIRSTAELTIGLLLSLLRQIPSASEHVLDGGWNRELFVGRELRGKTAGIIGYGRLGRIVARYLHAFGVQVLATTRGEAPADADPFVEFCDLPELLSRADIVSLHADFHEGNRGMIGREQFAAMRPGAWFVNTARGELVDEAALLAALQSGKLSGAALDVLSDERSTGMGDHPLVAYARQHANLLLTPHIGGNTMESLAMTEVFLAEKLKTRFDFSHGPMIR